MKKLKILVFPCGSEIGLEIHRSLKYSAHIELFGANSINDHGRFTYKNYFDGIPYIDDENIIPYLSKLVSKYKFDAIYPTMDKVIWKLKANERALGCKIIASNSNTTEICLSKRKTYETLHSIVNIPKIFNTPEEITSFPVFIKPDIGYGSRGVSKVNSKKELSCFFNFRLLSDYVVTEYLPGIEYTVDCFTDRLGELMFVGPRIRGRISNGISVYTQPIIEDASMFEEIAIKINQTIKLNGAWFFQVKKSANESLVLMEIASRLGGSSSLFRGIGVNFALLSIFNTFDIDIEILLNDSLIEMDRALDNKYKLNINYSTVYVDFDDCLIINKKNNLKLIKFLYSCLNKGKRIILITKHENDLKESLKTYRLSELFDEIIHIDKADSKAEYITDTNCIFIDDSFAERKTVKEKLEIPVFSPDMVEVLIN